MSSSKIYAIQNLRGIAALLVVVDHSLAHFSLSAGYDRETRQHIHLVAEALGRDGVDVFFLISGFIMTITSFGEFSRPGASWEFLRRRIIRIVPLYWLVTACALAWAVTQGHFPGVGSIIKSLLFIPYQSAPGLYQPILLRGWTLNYEMLFYALFAATLLQRAPSGIASLLVVLVTLTAVGLAGPFRDCTSELCGVLTFYQQPIMLYFAGGIVIGILRLFLRSQSPRYIVGHSNGFWLSLPLMLAYVASVCLWPDSPAVGLATIPVSFLIVSLCALSDEGASAGRTGWLFLMIGEASYSIYLTHTMVIDPASHIWGRYLPGVALYLYLPLMMLLAILFGYCTFRWAERPMLNALRGRRPLTQPAGGQITPDGETAAPHHSE